MCAALLSLLLAIAPLEIEDLLGRKAALPEVCAGRAVVLIVGFTRGSEAQTKPWAARLRGVLPADAVFHVAVLERVPRLVRGLVVRGIRNGTPQPERAQYLLAFRDEAEWRKLTEYTSGDDAWIVVMDREGRVRLRLHGPSSDSAVAAVKAAWSPAP